VLTRLELPTDKRELLRPLLDYMLSRRMLITLESDEDGSLLVDERDLERLNKLMPLFDADYSFEEIKKIMIALYGKTNKRTREKAYTIGLFAKELGVTRRTVDFWIEKGLLKPYSIANNGPRYFTEAELKTAQEIEQLKLIGYSLEQIKELFSAVTDENPEKLDEAIDDLSGRVKAARSAINSLDKGLLPSLKALSKELRDKPSS
jgi:DNA-binding transcriptional MerR regulator